MQDFHSNLATRQLICSKFYETPEESYYDICGGRKELLPGPTKIFVEL